MKKPVIQIDPQDLRVINCFDSIKDTKDLNGITPGNISPVKNKNKSNRSGSYYWKYLDEVVRESFMLGEMYKFIYGNDFDSMEAVKLGISTWNFRGYIDSCIPINLQYNHNDILYNEEWRDVIGYEGLYKISSFGRVISLWNKPYISLMSPALRIHGYLRISLYKDNIYINHSIHRLVALAFIPNLYNKPQVNHIDEVKTNNYIWNLNWMTAEENLNHGTRNERASISNSIPINKIDLKTGEIIESYSGVKEASKLNNIHRTNISGVLTGNLKSAGHFGWKYI